MNLWILGSGTLVPDARRGAPAHWVRAGRWDILMDCGSGTLRSLARFALPWARITHVLLSHLHTDHVGDLAPLLFALKHGTQPPRKEPLLVLGPDGLGRHMKHLAAAHGDYVLDPGFPLLVTELTPGDAWETGDGSLRIRTAGARHSRGALAFRIETGDGALGYTGDTGPAPGLGEFLRGCGVLVSECSHTDQLGAEGHLTPAAVASLAGQAHPRILITVHAYPPLDPEGIPDLIAQAGYGGRVRAGADGLWVELEGEKVIVRDPSAPERPRD